MKNMRLRALALAVTATWLMAAASGAAEPTKNDEKPGQPITNSLEMKMAWIPSGEFEMGSPLAQKGRQYDEAPHTVKITKPFRIAATEVTQAQWHAVMESAPAKFKGDDLPVDSISWKDADAFCKKLSAKEGRTYRLPTEAEWEYACRAGDKGRFSGAADMDELGWYMDNSEDKTHPVGAKKPNAWGLFDMSGNVAEWCADYYAPEYGDGPGVDPKGPEEGKARVIRGGSWRSTDTGCRCAARAAIPAAYQFNYAGFRVVLEESPR